MTRTATFTVSLSEAPAVAGSVHYSTVGKSAVEGSDYTAAAGTLNFNVGETSKTVSVTVQAVSDRSLTFGLKLSSASNLTIYKSILGIATIAPDNALVALVNTAKTRKTTYETAVTTYNNAVTARDTAYAEYVEANTAYEAAVTEQTAATADLSAAIARQNDAAQLVQQCTLLYATNSGYATALAIAVTQKSNADAAVTAANTRLSAANTALSSATSIKNTKYSAYTTADTAATSAKTAMNTAKTNYDSAKASAAAGFVGSTSLQL